MEQICATFNRLRQQHRKALVPFVMGGDPDLSLTPRLLLALQSLLFGWHARGGCLFGECGDLGVELIDLIEQGFQPVHVTGRG